MPTLFIFLALAALAETPVSSLPAVGSLSTQELALKSCIAGLANVKPGSDDFWKALAKCLREFPPLKPEGPFNSPIEIGYKALGPIACARQTFLKSFLKHVATPTPTPASCPPQSQPSSSVLPQPTATAIANPKPNFGKIADDFVSCLINGPANFPPSGSYPSSLTKDRVQACLAETVNNVIGKGGCLYLNARELTDFYWKLEEFLKCNGMEEDSS